MQEIKRSETPKVKHGKNTNVNMGLKTFPNEADRKIKKSFER
jgi:hypothetical protein